MLLLNKILTRKKYNSSLIKYIRKQKDQHTRLLSPWRTSPLAHNLNLYANLDFFKKSEALPSFNQQAQIAIVFE